MIGLHNFHGAIMGRMIFKTRTNEHKKRRTRKTRKTAWLSAISAFVFVCPLPSKFGYSCASGDSNQNLTNRISINKNGLPNIPKIALWGDYGAHN